MSNSKANTAKPNMAKFYKAEWKIQFDKLPKEEQVALTANLNKPDKQAGPRRVSNYDNVNDFVKSVTALAEEKFDKAVKERADKKSKAKSAK